MQCDTQLSVRAEMVRVQPATAAQGAPWVRLLSAEAHRAAWRLVEVASPDGQPFDLRLTWSAGDGSGQTVQITVATGTRIALYARHLEVRGRSKGSTEARIALHIADGFAPTHNVWIEVARVEEAVAVPAFARSVRAELSDITTADEAYLVLQGPTGVLAKVRLDRQPSCGVSVAGATHVRVRSPQQVPARLCFHLHL